jgi:maleate cis-trans isomerase
MTDPVTLTVGAIAALAFSKFLETSAGEAAKKLTPAVIDKIDNLRQKIWHKLRGIPEVDELNAAVESGNSVTEQQIKLLTPYLETAMKTDPAFAEDVRQLASEIHQEINIGEILGENVMNVYGGSAVQINDPKAPVITGDISGGNFTFNITN